ncbi:MAG: hypothetical protein OXE59_08210 [Bacteroidetes bacterium]|nr:hypothetical protein [Bacteroidota bacterium]
MRYALTMILVLCACDSVEDQQAFEDQAFAEPSGFTQTDESGAIKAMDDDDWRVSPAYVGRIIIDPAFPNPVSSGGLISIPVRVRFSDSVQGGLQLTAYDLDGIPRRLDSILNANDPGSYVFRFMPRTLQLQGLVRVFIIDTQGRLVSYGDVQTSG